MESIKVVPDIPCAVPPTCTPAKKYPGAARFIFISRISPKKNILQAVDLMSGISGASYDVYGPIEDRAYWAKCESLASRIDVVMRHRGNLTPEEVLPTFNRGHFFLFPTLSENFGHVIFESLAAGCPPIISNRTPWNDLMEQEAGWILPLEWPDMWKRVISRCIAMNQAQYDEVSQSSHRYAIEWMQRQQFSQKYTELFKTTGNNFRA